MNSLQYYIGQACRKYRRGCLDLTMADLATLTHVNISRLSLFENGKISSITPLQYYLTVSTKNAEILTNLVNEAINLYVSQNLLQKEGSNYES